MDDLRHISFAKKLDAWLRQRLNIDASVTDLTSLTPGGNLDFRYYGSKRVCDLYLRLWPDAFVDALGPGYWPANTLVIARLEFADTRAGHGRALLEFFVNQAELHGYDKIALECTYDGEGIQGFAKKFGFEHAWPELERPHSNWIASVTTVAERIDQTALPA